MLRPTLDELFVSSTNLEVKETIDYLYNESVLILSNFVVPIYATLSSQNFRPQVLPLISGIFEGVPWKTIDEIQISHSQYVDVLIRKFVEFRSSILRITVVTENSFDSLSYLYRCCAREIFQVFLMGISMVEHCTNEGRAKMQLDLQQLVMKLEALTCLKFDGESLIIKEYIQAFYLSDENELEAWIIKNKQNYTISSLNGLIAVFCNFNRIDGKKVQERVGEVLRLM